MKDNGTKPMLRTQEMILNMGPQHPSTHGVLRVVLDLDGEVVIKSKPYLGYLHRGTEKIAENRLYQQIIPLTDRMDYVCSMTNNYAYVRAVEKLLQLKIPERAECIRTLIAEVQRIAGHLFWLGTQALDIGAMTVFFYTFREREVLIDLFEHLCGARLTYSYYRIGGVDHDLDEAFITRLYTFLETFEEHVKEYDDLLADNRIWVARTKDIAVISGEDALNFGLSGATLRGSGVNYDLRKDEPYAWYDKVEWEVPLGKNGDVYDRYRVRVEEMLQSAKIVKQCLDMLPEGDILTDDPNVVLPPKAELGKSMESMIHHFKLVTSGIQVPAGEEIYCGTEVPKGELGFYIYSDGSGRPYRLKIRAPSFIHLGAFDYMAKGYMIADICTIFGTYDVVMGECDR